MDPIINGRGRTGRIVSVNHKRDAIYVYTESEQGVQLKVVPYKPWVLADTEIDESYSQLDGDNEYKYIRFFSSVKSWREHRREWKHSTWSPRSLPDAYLLSSGETYFKGITDHKDVSVLSFDLETVGLARDESAKILLISNTYRKGSTVIKKLFAYDDYDSTRHFLDAWSEWVRKMNPSVLITHNGTFFDIPYLLYCANRSGAELRIGRDGSALELALFESKFRVDGTRFLAYREPQIFGRELVDTMLLAYKYDAASKKYKSYGLKNIIAQENLEKPDRVFYDASTIRFKYKDPVEWQKIKEYCVDDSDDALALYDLMVPSTFFLTQVVPQTFTKVINSASGGQINSMLVRAYLSEGHSIPKGSPKVKYQGAISFGRPGVYKNMVKTDASQMYPSIMMQWQVHDLKKDPKGYFTRVVEYCAKTRQEYKALYKQTGSAQYKALEQVSKIIANSCYGALGSGENNNFNSPVAAEFVTLMGRKILLHLMHWATGGKEGEYVDWPQISWDDYYRSKF